MLRNDQAKKLTTNFGYFQAQLKGLTLEDAKLQRYEPLHHISGNHLRCGDWCCGKKALEMGLQYKRPMLDLKKEQDQKTFEGI